MMYTRSTLTLGHCMSMVRTWKLANRLRSPWQSAFGTQNCFATPVRSPLPRDFMQPRNATPNRHDSVGLSSAKIGGTNTAQEEGVHAANQLNDYGRDGGCRSSYTGSTTCRTSTWRKG